MGAKRESYTRHRKENTGRWGTKKQKRGNRGECDEERCLKNDSKSGPHMSFVRKKVDPEIIKYFSEISIALENLELKPDDRTLICNNAIEESKGKEVELATDYIISHIIQKLMEGCDLEHLRGFLENCGDGFLLIANDRSGSHVVETAIKSFIVHLQNDATYSDVETSLRTFCKVICENPIKVMSNCYGSHVLRRLFCVLKGRELECSEFDLRKSCVLADRLSIRDSRKVEGGNEPLQSHEFPQLLGFLVSEILNHVEQDIGAVRLNQYCSLVLQTILKALEGDEKELMHAIPLILGCRRESEEEVEKIRQLMSDTSVGHLMEVVLQVAPEPLYVELLEKFFRGSLFELSSDQCANFAVQALISRAAKRRHLKLIWKEIGGRFRDLLCVGKSGVVASFVAACQRLHTLEAECCEALTAAVRSAEDPADSIVPRLLFLHAKDAGMWDRGLKVHLMGSLILQIVFRFPRECIAPFTRSITSLEVENLREMLRDSGGARVLEAFLASRVSTRLKTRLISRLEGHFGEIALHRWGSFTVEKCFSGSGERLKERIVSDLCLVLDELSRTKHGPYLLLSLDARGYMASPDRWRSRLESKRSVYNKFHATFGGAESEAFHG